MSSFRLNGGTRYQTHIHTTKKQHTHLSQSIRCAMSISFAWFWYEFRVSKKWASAAPRIWNSKSNTLCDMCEFEFVCVFYLFLFLLYCNHDYTNNKFKSKLVYAVLWIMYFQWVRVIRERHDQRL